MESSSLFDDNVPMQEPHAPYSQSVLGNDFMFQQTLAVHQGAVRSISCLDSGYMISGSIDTTSKMFMLNNATGRYDFDKENNYHSSFVYATAPSVNGSSFFTGGKDGKIFQIDLMGNPLNMLEGHESAVNSLSQCLPDELVSGSWDGTARIWDLETGKVKQVLTGHSHATAVLTLQNGITVTGSQDKKIRLWFQGNLEKEFIAHDDIIRQFAEVPGVGFVSCSNDETLKLWTIDGQKLSELKGHTGFVFSVCVLDSGEIVSASDDKSVRVWRDGTCVQVINHPRTIWTVTKNHLGDIITGGEDYKIRTFTRDPARAEKGAALEEYKNECTATDLGEQIDMKTLPTIDKMRSIKAKEGEVKIFKNGSSAEAYCFKDGKWEKIGDVMNPTASIDADGKQYEGDRMFPAGNYDHVFDVDLGDGIMRKLPFDNGQNPLVSADKFILREGLNKAYCEQISQFIKNNSLAYATSKNAQSKLGEQQKAIDQVMQKAEKAGVIPMNKYLFFDAVNVDGPKKKLLEFNQELGGLLTEQDLTLLDSLLELIKNKAFYHSSKVSKQGFELIKKLLTKFPSAKSFPALDIYRMFLMHPHSSENYKLYEFAIEYIGIIIGHLRDDSAQQATQLVALRSLVNLFQNSASLYVVQQKRQYLLDSASQYVYSDNKNVRQAAITLLLNYSILFLDKADPDGKIQLVSAVSGGALQKETDGQNFLRLMTMLGNIAHQDKDTKDAIVGMVGDEINEKLKGLSKLEGVDEKTTQTIKDIHSLLFK